MLTLSSEIVYLTFYGLILHAYICRAQVLITLIGSNYFYFLFLLILVFFSPNATCQVENMCVVAGTLFKFNFKGKHRCTREGGTGYNTFGLGPSSTFLFIIVQILKTYLLIICLSVLMNTAMFMLVKLSKLP